VHASTRTATTLEIGPSDDPIAAMRRWYGDAEAALSSDEAHAFVLATVGPTGTPSARVVLCRSLDDAGGLVFYTNYESRKARELDTAGRAAGVFHWWSLGRQCRVEGSVKRCCAAVSDAYWASRPRASQLSALASPQSRPVGSTAEVEARHTDLERRYAGGPIERPPWWGGYVLVPDAVEFWLRGDARMHARVRFEREDARWSGVWLAP
jgi:pyridoxamine 5'-phosphate oxidase